MGYYINPKGCTKEEWLMANGTEYAVETIKAKMVAGDTGTPVCLVTNRHFTAAAVCYSPREFDVFNDRTDPRFKRWYLVPAAAIARGINEGAIPAFNRAW